PVCALVRNDMQKTDGLQRLQGVVRNDTSPLSVRGAKRRGNPHLLRQHKTMRKYLRQIRRSCEFALSAAYCSVLLQGERIAAPVCALVRNDMQKAVACQRLQGVVRNDMQKAVACQ